MRSCYPTPLSAHPRSRGEHPHLRGDRPVRCGSSPLARGTRVQVRNSRRAVRLIPARAGNTSSSRRLRFMISAHPRSRGEHMRSTSIPRYSSGSSPLARGTLMSRPIHGSDKRLIPARAGNTSDSMACWLWRSAHPRSRGEHCWSVLLHWSLIGSSPLARGTPWGQSSDGVATRLIPARAGNTL